MAFVHYWLSPDVSILGDRRKRSGGEDRGRKGSKEMAGKVTGVGQPYTGPTTWVLLADVV